jgi:hypothetical protein
MNKRRTDNTMNKRRTDNTMNKRRTDNTMNKRKITKGQTTIYKTLQIKLKIKVDPTETHVNFKD